MKLSPTSYVGAGDLIPLKADCIYSFPLGEAKTGDRERLSRAVMLSLPAHPHETCAHSWAPSEAGRGSEAAQGAPKMFPQTLGCRSMGDHWSHPLTAPSLRSTPVGRRWTEKGQEIEEVRGNKALQGVVRGLRRGLQKGCPRLCAPCWGGSNTPVHFRRQRAPPIPLG